MKLKISNYHEVEVEPGKRFIDLLADLDLKDKDNIVSAKYNGEYI